MFLQSSSLIKFLLEIKLINCMPRTTFTLIDYKSMGKYFVVQG